MIRKTEGGSLGPATDIVRQMNPGCCVVVVGIVQILPDGGLRIPVDVAMASVVDSFFVAGAKERIAEALIRALEAECSEFEVVVDDEDDFPKGA